MTKITLSEFKQAFIKTYGSINAQNVQTYFAPGRVNLIGEHIDYNGGMVLPVAISYGTYLMCAFNNEKVFRFMSLDFEGITEVPIDEPFMIADFVNNWCKYPLGVIDQFKKLGTNLLGIDFLYSGDLPYSAGLSSSASIEMVTAVAMNGIMAANQNMIELVKIAKKAENEFVGVSCGIMDMFASGMGRKNHAMLLNCDTLDLKQVPFDTGDYSIIIMNTNKKRGLADSKYNERVEECTLALSSINTANNYSNLCEIKPDEAEKALLLIDNEVIRRRAQHVISENKRVHQAVEALEKGDLVEFGKLMTASHQSLKEDYEVTGLELDTIVELALQQPGVLGARMTGAGFGGCAISLVKRDNIADFIENTSKLYAKAVGLTAGFFPAEIECGAYRIA
jgi:galactokinase